MCVDPEWFQYRTWKELTGKDSRLKLQARNRTEFERLVPVVYRDKLGAYYNYVIKLDKTHPDRVRLTSALLHDLVYV